MQILGFAGKKTNETIVEEIILEQYNQYYRLADSYVHNEADAEDIVQNVFIKLLQNNTYYSEAIVSLPEQSYTWNDLDEFDEYGNKFVYSIEHHEVENYASSLNSSTNSIIYSYIKPKIDYTITKIWNDRNNILNSRPENYTLYLLKNKTNITRLR